MNKYRNANAVFCEFGKSYLRWQKDLPVRPSEMGVLNVLVKSDEAFTPLKLAEYLEISKSMVTAHINVLEKSGYVYRDYVPSDKRSFYVVPTEKAKTLVEESERRLNESLAKIESALGTEKFTTLVTLLDEVEHILQK